MTELRAHILSCISPFFLSSNRRPEKFMLATFQSWLDAFIQQVQAAIREFNLIVSWYSTQHNRFQQQQQQEDFWCCCCCCFLIDWNTHSPLMDDSETFQKRLTCPFFFPIRIQSNDDIYHQMPQLLIHTQTWKLCCCTYESCAFILIS